jgi:hypothetical protein
MRDRLRVFAGLAHDDEVIRDALAAHGAVFAQLLVKQSESLGALHGDNRVFPDTHFRVVNEPGFLVSADDFAAKVLQADIAVPRFGRRQAACSGLPPVGPAS